MNHSAGSFSAATAICFLLVSVVLSLIIPSSVAADWADVTGPLSLGCTGAAWGDFDSDGDPDLYLANPSGANRLYRNDQGLGFVDVTSSPLGNTGNGRGVAWGDFDNDEDLDLYLANVGSSNKLFRNENGITFSDATSSPLNDGGNGWGVSWGDYNSDGLLDLSLANGDGYLRVFRNVGSGTFSEAYNFGFRAWMQPTWIDMDNDGDMDLFATEFNSGSHLFRNDGVAGLQESTPPTLNVTALGQAWGDYDNDGDLDAYLTRWGVPNLLARNDGGGVFVDVTSPSLADLGFGRGAEWLDFDRDGDLDLAFGNSLSPSRLLRNDSGTFVDSVFPMGPNGTTAVIGADYDCDGDVDLFVAASGGGRLYRNDDAGTAHWLHLSLVGTVSNVAAIGARVRLTTDGLSQIREISGGASYQGQSSLEISFGLGSADNADLEIHWPSGLVQLVTNVAADQQVTITEDQVPPPPPTYDWVDVTSGSLAAGGTGAAWGDYDKDGDPDLFVANPGGPDRLFRNDGEFGLVQVNGGPLADPGVGRGVAWADQDNDDDLDLYLANEGTANRLFRNEGAGTFASIASPPIDDNGLGWGTAWGDYNQDGRVDLALGNSNGELRVFRNVGSGTFESEVDLGFHAWMQPAWVDHDNDGDLDLFATEFNDQSRLFRNEGSGTFTDMTPPVLAVTALGQAWGDYDNDGDLDVYLTRWGVGNRLARNDGGGVFHDATTPVLGDDGFGRGATWLDIDRDADLDLAFGSSLTPRRILRNDSGNFVDVPLPSGPAGTAAVIGSDYDLDGDMDLFVSGSGGGRLLRNDTPNANHWIEVALKGVLSNTAGIGARIVLVSGSLTQIREISGGETYQGQSDLVAHFGLGSSSTVNMTVLWPSGIVQHMTGVTADQRFTVTEAGSGAIEASLDVLPDQCPNLLNPKSNGILQVAVVGTPTFDVTIVDVGAVTINGSVAPTGSMILDLTSPADNEECACSEAGPDGILDLVLEFRNRAVVNSVGPIPPGETRVLLLAGLLTDGQAFEGKDCVGAKPLGKGVVILGAVHSASSGLATISYSLDTQAPVSLGIFDIRGAKVRTLIEGIQSAGTHSFEWNTNDLASGVYFYRFHADGRSEARKFVIVQ